jgi:hypothetical protein
MPSPLNGVCAKLNTVVAPGVGAVSAWCMNAGYIAARGLLIAGSPATLMLRIPEPASGERH